MSKKFNFDKFTAGWSDQRRLFMAIIIDYLSKNQAINSQKMTAELFILHGIAPKALRDFLKYLIICDVIKISNSIVTFNSKSPLIQKYLRDKDGDTDVVA